MSSVSDAQLRQAKAALPLLSLTHQLGLEAHAKKSAKCPFHDDNNNSFSVYKNQRGEWAWKCHAGCGGGDNISFLARLHGITNSGACALLIQLAAERCLPVVSEIPLRAIIHAPSPMPTIVAEAWDEGVDYVLSHPEFIEELTTSRGWSVSFTTYLAECAIISAPRVGSGFRGIAFQVVVPTGQPGQMTTSVVGYHVRLPTGPAHKPIWCYRPNEKTDNQSIPATPFVIGDMERAQALIITEGQWDALTFGLAAGWLGKNCSWPPTVAVIGIRGSSGVNTFLYHYKRFWPSSAKCLLLPDSDAAGKSWHTGENSFAQRLAVLCEKVSVVACSSQKDFNDLYRIEKITPTDIAALLSRHDIVVNNEGTI